MLFNQTTYVSLAEQILQCCNGQAVDFIANQHLR
jgi:hypothetical protein